MTEMLLMLLIAAAVPIAAAAVATALEDGLPKLSARQRGLPRRSTLSVAALLALVSTLVVAESPVNAAEGDMHTLSGTITDLEGAALADITVSVYCQDCNGSSSDPSANPARPWPATTWGSGARLLGEATTDASGIWSVTVAEPSAGWLRVVAWDPDGDYALQVVSAWGWESHSDLNTSLADGGQLSGRILADGAAPPATNFILSRYGENWSLVVAPNGDYRTPGLPDGQYSVSYPADLAKPYVAGASFPLGTISEGTDSVADHNLVKYGSVSGRVTDGAGRALSGIRVVASPVGTSAWMVTTPFGGGAAVTVADGTYSIDTVVPGIVFVIEFHSPDGDYASEYYDDQSQFWEGDRVAVPTEGSVSGIDAQLAPGGRVSGQVRDDAGEPVAGAWVTLCVQDGYNCQYMSADDSGFFEFGGLAPSIYTLQGGGIERCVIVAEGKHVQLNLNEGDAPQRVYTEEGPSPIVDFFDVPQDTYYTEPVTTLAEQGVFAGTEWGNGFCPDAPIDRKTMAVWTVRVLDGEDPPGVSESRFDDVNSWGLHAPFIERMADLEVTTGCGDGTRFCPDDTLTRAQMATFLSRAYKLADGPDPGFTDVPSDAWYAANVAKLAASGITSGCGDGPRFCPGQNTTRAQMATFLHRAETRDN